MPALPAFIFPYLTSWVVFVPLRLQSYNFFLIYARVLRIFVLFYSVFLRYFHFEIFFSNCSITVQNCPGRRLRILVMMVASEGKGFISAEDED